MIKCKPNVKPAGAVFPSAQSVCHSVFRRTLVLWREGRFSGHSHTWLIALALAYTFILLAAYIPQQALSGALILLALLQHGHLPEGLLGVETNGRVILLLLGRAWRLPFAGHRGVDGEVGVCLAGRV